jgi:hypothetical protein
MHWDKDAPVLAHCIWHFPKAGYRVDGKGTQIGWHVGGILVVGNLHRPSKTDLELPVAKADMIGALYVLVVWSD